MSQRCEYPLTVSGLPCRNLVAPGSDHCSATHPVKAPATRAEAPDSQELEQGAYELDELIELASSRERRMEEYRDFFDAAFSTPDFGAVHEARAKDVWGGWDTSKPLPKHLFWVVDDGFADVVDDHPGRAYMGTVVRSFADVANEHLPEFLGYLPALATVDDTDEARRARVFADFDSAVRSSLPLLLQHLGGAAHLEEELASLPPITDEISAEKAHGALRLVASGLGKLTGERGGDDQDSHYRPEYMGALSRLRFLQSGLRAIATGVESRRPSFGRLPREYRVLEDTDRMSAGFEMTVFACNTVGYDKVPWRAHLQRLTGLDAVPNPIYPKRPDLPGWVDDKPVVQQQSRRWWRRETKNRVA